MANSKQRYQDLAKLFYIIVACSVALGIAVISVQQEQESKPDQEKEVPGVKTFQDCNCLDSQIEKQ